MSRPTIADLQAQIRTQANSIANLTSECANASDSLKILTRRITDYNTANKSQRTRIIAQHKTLLIFMNQRNLLHAMLDGMGVSPFWNNKKQSVVARLRRKLIGR